MLSSMDLPRASLSLWAQQVSRSAGNRANPLLGNLRLRYVYITILRQVHTYLCYICMKLLTWKNMCVCMTGFSYVGAKNLSLLRPHCSPGYEVISYTFSPLGKGTAQNPIFALPCFTSLIMDVLLQVHRQYLILYIYTWRNPMKRMISSKVPLCLRKRRKRGTTGHTVQWLPSNSVGPREICTLDHREVWI